MAPGSPTTPSPMWLSHHEPDAYDRCVELGGHHVCRRCAVLYPLAVAVAVVQVAGTIPDDVGGWVMWLAPVGVVVEWLAEHLGGRRYSPRRQVALTALAAPALGVALGRHAVDPFVASAVVPMVVWTAVCLAGWVVGASLRSAGRDDDGWERDFEAAEASRWSELEARLGDQEPAGGAATKSISSSTAPTSDGSRSL